MTPNRNRAPTIEANRVKKPRIKQIPTPIVTAVVTLLMKVSFD